MKTPAVIVHPRIPKPQNTTSPALGPGAYFKQDKKTINKREDPEVNRHNLYFGLEQRFNNPQGRDSVANPGPGQYNDPNKWNKRTYNLKFLNLQANAAKNQSLEKVKSSVF